MGDNMQAKRLLQIGGVINFLFVIFHLSFWELLNWYRGLESLSSDNRAVMQVLNIHNAYVLGMFAFMSFAFADTITTTKLGRSIGIGIATFWILRAVNQVVFWGITDVSSWVIITICLVTAALYVIPSVRSQKKNG